MFENFCVGGYGIVLNNDKLELCFNFSQDIIDIIAIAMANITYIFIVM